MKRYQVTFPEVRLIKAIIEIEDDCDYTVRDCVTMGMYEEYEVLEDYPLDDSDWEISELPIV